MNSSNIFNNFTQNLFFISATSLESSLTQPVLVTEGSDALLTCVAVKLGEHTVIWKAGRDKILTAGAKRVTSDKRFAVLHDEGKLEKKFAQMLNLAKVQTLISQN